MHAPIHTFKIAALTACCALLHAGAAAQDVSPRDQAVGIQGMLDTTASPEPEDPGAESDEYQFLEETMNYELKRHRNWRLRVFGSASWRHDSNIMLSNTNEVSDNVYSFRPGFQYSLGDEESTLQFIADYSCLFNFFQDNTSQDSVNHFLSTALNLRADKTSMKIGLMVTEVTGGDLDVGGQAQRFQMTPDVDLRYELTDKIRMGISAQMQQYDYDALISSTTYRLGIYADYAFSPQLWLGLQFNEMILDVDQVGRQTGHDLLVRVDWEAFEKLHIDGNFGVHMLQTESAGDSVLPSGKLGLRYEIGPKTAFHASAYARAQNSPSLAGQYFQSSGVTMGVTQQLGTKASLGADLGYDFAEYRSYQSSTTSSRRDRVVFVRPWLKYSISRRLTLDFFYQHTTNTSTGAGAQGFKRDLVGMGLTGSW